MRYVEMRFDYGRCLGVAIDMRPIKQYRNAVRHYMRSNTEPLSWRKRIKARQLLKYVARVKMNKPHLLYNFTRKQETRK